MNVMKLKEKWGKLVTEESILKALDFQPRPSDVLINTARKCGTTWMQQIVHQLRTGGDMEFSDIHEVVPFMEAAYDLHMDLNAEQRQNPRCYKTHTWFPHCPKGGKYIVIYREPCAVAYSHYNFFKGWFFQPGQITLDEFVKEFLFTFGKPKSKKDKPSYFEHLASWWEYRNNPNVLFLFFEEMKEDLENVVKAVASFIGVEDDESIKNAIKMSSFDFMKASDHKFQENLLTKHRNQACDLPDSAVPKKVVTGSINKAKEIMSDEVKEAIQEKWRNIVTEKTGYQTYDELRIAVRKEKPLIK